MSDLNSVLGSARWAAYGDILGFITELTDAAGVKQRIGSPRVERPVAWRRKVGGQFGVEASLPAGAYSDDTQLRLATCRAIRGDGRFDVEAFSKVELPVWSSYALGAGRGSRAAATSLTRHVYTWSTNFFEEKSTRYVDGGGNGAAMRVQPHVWSARNPGDMASYLPDVLRNSLTTHGHPNGFLGAAFHAMVLAFALHEGELPHPRRVQQALPELRVIRAIVHNDADLQDFWLSKWERESNRTLSTAVDETIRDMREMLNVALAVEAGEPPYMYSRIADTLALRDPKVRGSGTHTAIAAYLLAWLFKEDPLAAMVTAANELGTDTDSIGTMAGALIGAVTSLEIPGVIQDLRYIDQEACRLQAIGASHMESSFSYPDLLRWEPPQSQSDAVGLVGGKPALSGLGFVVEQGPAFQRAGKDVKNVWQWMTLDFGQSILAKVRQPIPDLSPSSAPTRRQNDIAKLAGKREIPRQLTLTSDEHAEPEMPEPISIRIEAGATEPAASRRFWEVRRAPDHSVRGEKAAERERKAQGSLPDTETLATRIEDSGFKHDLIGRYIERFAHIEHGPELGAVFAAAVIRRMRRRGRDNP
ncbi:MAG TPA: ADP-ribosylglycohydrolase family protein [Candidatus Elarobacter sp.]|jgi:ADP-ribosylglycohydrolase|nr:ADP-ribosylglycohydrolase family protein [Candidatus Elarobacter sp.]